MEEKVTLKVRQKIKLLFYGYLLKGEQNSCSIDDSEDMDWYVRWK